MRGRNGGGNGTFAGRTVAAGKVGGGSAIVGAMDGLISGMPMFEGTSPILSSGNFISPK
jgi:hypothetical protein